MFAEVYGEQDISCQYLPKIGNVSDGIHDGNMGLSNKNAN